MGGTQGWGGGGGRLIGLSVGGELLRAGGMFCKKGMCRWIMLVHHKRTDHRMNTVFT